MRKVWARRLQERSLGTSRRNVRSHAAAVLARRGRPCQAFGAAKIDGPRRRNASCEAAFVYRESVRRAGNAAARQNQPGRIVHASALYTAPATRPAVNVSPHEAPRTPAGTFSAVILRLNCSICRKRAERNQCVTSTGEFARGRSGI